MVRVETTLYMDVKNKILHIKNKKQLREGESVKTKKNFENKITKNLKKILFLFYPNLLKILEDKLSRDTI